MLERFNKHIIQNLPFLKESKLLIAISGGIDSVVLMHLCRAANFKFALAHCNFNLRGKESDADEDFIVQLADDLEIEVFVQNFETETYAKTHKLSTQMAARELRYNWFNDLAIQFKFDYILTAHHADDDLETFLINLTRGTGLEGFTGIPIINNNTVRPLLPFSRLEIEAYANDNNLKWREDSTNASTKYLRNKIRHEVIPVLKDINPQLLQTFSQTQAFLKDSKAIIDDRIDDVSDKVIKDITEFEIQFDISEIKQLSHPKAYLYELLKVYGFSEWNDVFNLLDAQSGKQVFSETHRLIKDRDYLLLSDLNTEDKQQVITISECDDKIKTTAGVLFFDEADAIFGKDANRIFVDKKKLKFPLTVRHWQEGDYFHPLGMKGKKKLSKYFKDEKMSLLDKENTLLLCSGDYIIWVIGKRADSRFKVTDKTKKIIKIELK